MLVLKGKSKLDKYLIDEDYFKRWSHDMAYILGFIVADGNVQKNGNCIKVEVEPDDISVLEFICSQVTPDYRIRPSNRKTEVRWHPSSFIMKNDLVNLGVIPKKTGAEIVPPNIPDEYLWDFIRGYFDGDGTIADCYVSITCNSKTFLQDLCNRVKIGYVTKDRMNSKWVIEQKECVVAFMSKLYASGNFCLVRKKNLMESLHISKIRGRFTDDEDCYLFEHRDLMTRRELAINLGRTGISVKNRLQRLKIRKAA